MSILRPSPVMNTNQFNWCPKTRTFTAEASTLRHNGNHAFDVGFPRLGRVYDDAADEGFTLVSERTHRDAIMYLSNVTESEDYSGGWVKLEFRPIGHTNFKLVIFND